MLYFFIGLLVGAVVMDLLWAWKTGIVEALLQNINLKIKLWKAGRL